MYTLGAKLPEPGTPLGMQAVFVEADELFELPLLVQVKPANTS